MNATTSPLGGKLPRSHALFAATSSVGACVAFPLRAQRMATDLDRAPPTTEIPPPESEQDLHPCGYWTSGLEVEHVRRADASAGDGLVIGHMLSGRYRIERELGEGGMGVVYLAADEQVAGERFAIKVLKEELRPASLARLREEVRKTRKLSHPNIVDVHSVNVDGQRLYLLMEYLEGKSLDALLNEEFGRGMPFSHALPIIEDIGAALGNAHDRNVTHSDLKPANVFLTTWGRTKLLDFGIARVSRGPLLQSRSGSHALTRAYASCEMLQGKEADRRDDIYSFACVIYEMLCGERPFGDLTALEAREDAAQMKPLEGLSREQNGALARALAFDREARTGSVETLLAGLAVGAKPRARRPAGVFGAAILVVMAAVGLTYIALEGLWVARHAVVVEAATSNAQIPPLTNVPTTAAFTPPPHSLAVLPFLNMSGDASQDYFSDGLSEELLNSLSRVNGLQVAARTSSFYFKGKDVDLPTITHKLNVASVLEGSVRRSGNKIRVTAQLNNAVTGFHVWSQTYDRDLSDVLQLETDVANAVASALKVTLLGDVAAKIELGGTRNPAAFDAYMRASKAYWEYPRADKNNYAKAATALYTEAIRLDPHYALAYAGRSIAQLELVIYHVSGPAARDYLNKAQADARKVIALAPDLAEGHLALAVFLATCLDFRRANEEFERALALDPGSARVLQNYGQFAVNMGHTEAGLAALRRAVALDPLNVSHHGLLIIGLRLARHFNESLAAYQEFLSFFPNIPEGQLIGATLYYSLGDFEKTRLLCDSKLKKVVDEHSGAEARAILAVCQYPNVSRHAGAETALKDFKASQGDDGAYEYAKIYAQWGDTANALEWLETALRLRAVGLQELKVEALLDPLRNDPRFQAIERELQFPN